MNKKTLTKSQTIWGIFIWIVIFGLADWSSHTGITNSLIQILIGPAIITLYYLTTKNKSKNKEKNSGPIVDERIEQRVRYSISAISLPFLVFTLFLAFFLQSVFNIHSIPIRYIELYALLACLGLLTIAAVIRRR